VNSTELSVQLVIVTGPVSVMRTHPPPYSPAGISPSKWA